jgi:histidinol-phosphatase (PHP family)
MGYKQCLHTHSNLCDGKDSLEEMVQTAIEKGFDSIGFSGHSFMDIYAEFSMNEEKIAQYKAEIARLQQVYGDRIRIFCGLEKDNYTTVSTAGFDYLIGSVHVVKHEKELLFIDWSAERTRETIETIFDGDGIAYAKCYFDAVADLPNHGSFDILGHFDIISKNVELADLFDMEAPEYIDAAVQALETLRPHIPIFEVNTGAIARGYRTSPYPSRTLLKIMKEMDFRAVISSDCHDATKLTCGFDMAKDLLKECGFREHYILTDSGFVPVEL